MGVRLRRAVLALSVVLLVAACSPGPGSGGQLEATRWVLDSYAQAGTLTIVDQALYADAEFASHRVAGFAGCNEFNALYRAGGRSLFVSNPSKTLAACDEATMDFEQAYVTLLGESRFYTVFRDTLTVYDGDRNTILRFDAAPRNPLLGVWQVDSFETAPSTVSAVAGGTALDVVFRLGTLGGSAGCNSFTGVYGTNGSAVRIGRLALTRLTCDQAVMDQEAAFVAALEGGSSIESRGRQVNLTDRDGHLKVALVRPTPPESASPSAEPSATPTAQPTEPPSEEPTATATAKPTPTPTAKPTATPTQAPTAAPTGTPKPTPSASAPASVAPTATCSLGPDTPAVATIVYPGTWFTLTEPPELACRFFDPAEIIVPPDGSPPKAAVMADVLATSYQDAVSAATDPGTWTVGKSSEAEVDGLPVTCVAAVAQAATEGVAKGEARSVCLVQVGSAETVAISATGTPGDGFYLAKSAIVSLMTLGSTYTPGS
jgi:heat shock protein HslJ